MRAIRLPTAVGLCAVLALVAGSVAAAGEVGRASTNRAIASLDVRALLMLEQLPAGAARLTGAPAGARAIDNALPNQSTPDLVDVHSWWRVPGTPEAVIAEVKAHRPRGSGSARSGGGSALIGHSTSSFTYVTFTFPARAGVLESRTLIVKATALATAMTAVRVDAEDVWVKPRPASERIPDAVHEVDVTRGVSGKPPTVSVSVTDARKVRAIVNLVDSLGVVQPGEIACPFIPTNGPRVSLTFRANAHGAALAQASQLDLAFQGPCNPLSLRIDGHTQIPLLAGGDFLTAVGKLVGRKLAASG
jgi:hypothetical protein